MPNSSDRSDKPRTTSLSAGIRGVLGGRIGLIPALREGFRRGRAMSSCRRERAMLADLATQPVRLLPEFQSLSPSDLLNHFRERATPAFLPGFAAGETTASLGRSQFPNETQSLIEAAWVIIKEHRWPLLGFGEQEFSNPVNWHRDPLSARSWPLDYHAHISLWHRDGSDIRVLWELNRLGHLITLGRAYAVTNEEEFAAEFFVQLESWQQQNPVGLGANWTCAMEAALRVINLLAAFSLFRRSSHLNEERLPLLLTMFDQHGSHIRRHLEFSYVATSNHYLSDIAGLLWLGILLPEFAAAKEWREWALAEMLHEMEKQILPDGADYESSTGYHCFVVELFLYSFVLCRTNGIPIAEKYWHKLHSMLVYLRAMLRPDGTLPLIGDADGGRFVPVGSRSAYDQAYVPAIGAAVFKDSQFRLANQAPPELLWVLGEQGFRHYEQLAGANEETSSQAFPDAGSYVLRNEDLHLVFNANGARKGRPASHRHNDALSLEVFACGRSLIVDPGCYVYTADLHERHQFRSTSYHSTLQIDEVEQNTIREDAPFVMGDEARVQVLSWQSTPDMDRIVAEHSGYERLREPVRHRRTVTFHKAERWWSIEDKLSGSGEHELAVRFHFDAGLAVSPGDNHSVMAFDETSGARLLVCSLELHKPAELEAQFTSRHYGARLESLSACWRTRSNVPCKLGWAILPVSPGDDLDERLSVVQSPKSKVQSSDIRNTLDFGR